MGRSWGQRSLIKCNWILLEGSLIPRPCLCAGRAWEQGYLEGAGKSNFLFCFCAKKRKKEFIIPNSFLCFLREREKGIRIAWFAIPFMLSSEKGKRTPSFWIPFLLSWEKGKRNPSLIPFVNSSDKWKRNAWFRIPFLFPSEKRKKECIRLSLFFVFFRKKAKGTRVSEFYFSFCQGKEKGNMPRVFNFSFPGRSKYDKISWNSFSKKLIY